MKSFNPITNEQALDLIEDLEEYTQVNTYMDDEDVTKILGYVRRLIAKPDVPAVHAPVLVTQLEALSANFAIMATFHMTIKKDTKRKNMYYTLRDKTKDLADAVKYLAR